MLFVSISFVCVRVLDHFRALATVSRLRQQAISSMSGACVWLLTAVSIQIDERLLLFKI
jgi:hypothetical protein